MATRILDAKDESLGALDHWGFPKSREIGKRMAFAGKKESRLQKVGGKPHPHLAQILLPKIPKNMYFPNVLKYWYKRWAHGTSK